MSESSENKRLRAKLEQAHAVIEHLVAHSESPGSEGRRAIEYFASDHYDATFLPWPRHEDEGTRPEDLNAANDD